MRSVEARGLYERCIIKGCMDETYARGLCHKHYSKTYYLISQGIETWDSLIKCGMASPLRKAESIKEKPEVIGEAIIKLHSMKIYPSVRKIMIAIGRKPSGLKLEEKKIRDEMFNKLGISKSSRGSGISLC